MTTEKAHISAAIDELATVLGDRLSTSQAVRDHHGADLTYHGKMPPDAVAFVKSEAEVAAIMRICARHNTPVIPFGAGTSLEGHFLAAHGGVCIDLTQMDQILRVSREDMDVTVQPGVTREKLNEYLRDTGLFFPIDPGANATIGGMASTRASGTNAVRYGTMRENVLNLSVVLADGRIIKTARRARKSSAGYDLTRLFVGAEGTLGVITGITLRLYGIPDVISSAVCPFDSLEGAVNAVILTIQSGAPIARIELLNATQMKAINNFSNLGCAEQPTLFLEFHGSEASVAEQVDQVRTIASDFGGGDFQWATRTEDRNKLWQARHNAAFAIVAMRPGAAFLPTDVCVPISRLADCILETEDDLASEGVLAPIVGHVGDGNFHVTLSFDRDDEEEVAKVKRLNERLVQRALAMEGTCTGEHGVGLGKMDFLVAEHGEALSVMRAVKQALDPANIMNPGKIIRV
ncbi:MAG: FAD-binding oxidoreductase [Sphingomonadales bacterium]